jgi:sec-independent protein translocase protein TatA
MIGTGELIVIFCVILLLFGGKKLPELAKSLGEGIREFKKATNGESKDDSISKIEKKDPNEP